MHANDTTTFVNGLPLGQLEQALIDQFVRACGHDPHHLSELSNDERDTVLKRASIYASSRLSEVEARSHFLEELRAPG